MLDQTAIGHTVYTDDGKEIGRVKELRGNFFKVDAPMAPDYWLRDDLVRSMTGDIHLNIPEHLMIDYMVDDPDSGTPDTPGHTGDSPDLVTTRASEGADAAHGFWSDDISQSYRREWQVGHPVENWDDYELGYRYGHEMAYNPRFQGRTWMDAESDLSRDFTAWRDRGGYRTTVTWISIKDSVQEAFDNVRRRMAA